MASYVVQYVPARPGDFGVFAVGEIDAGDWIIREEPLVKIPLTQAQDAEEFVGDLACVGPAPPALQARSQEGETKSIMSAQNSAARKLANFIFSSSHLGSVHPVPSKDS